MQSRAPVQAHARRVARCRPRHGLRPTRLSEGAHPGPSQGRQPPHRPPTSRTISHQPRETLIPSCIECHQRFAAQTSHSGHGRRGLSFSVSTPPPRRLHVTRTPRFFEPAHKNYFLISHFQKVFSFKRGSTVCRNHDESQPQRKQQNLFWRPSSRTCICDTDTARTLARTKLPRIAFINQVGRQTECGCLFGCCTHDDICQLAGKNAAVRGTIWFS